MTTTRFLAPRVVLRVLQVGALLVVLVATPYKLFELDRFFIPKELVLHLVALAAAATLLASARRLTLTRADQLFALGAGLALLSGIFATNWWAAGRAVAIAISGVICFWGARAVAGAGHARPLIAAIAAAGCVGAATALLQAYGFRPELFSLNRAPGGTFGNRNFMAHLAVLTYPALLYVAMETRGKGRGWLVGAACVGAALVLSRTRAAWLAFIVGAAVYAPLAWLTLRGAEDLPRRAAIHRVLVATVAGAAAAVLLPNALEWRSDSPYLETARTVVSYSGGSGAGRLVQYRNTVGMAAHHPVLGVGPGNWAVEYPRFADRGDPSLAGGGLTANPWASSDWVTLLAERGAFGFAAIIVGLTALLVDAGRAIIRGVDGEQRTAAAALVATLAMLVVVGAFDAVLLLPAPALIAWSALGALAAPSRPRMVVELTDTRRLAATAAIVVLCAAAAWRSWRQLGAMAIYNRTSRASAIERAARMDPGSYRIRSRLASSYAARGDCRRARPHARAAAALYPSATEPRRVLAGCRGITTSTPPTPSTP